MTKRRILVAAGIAVALASNPARAQWVVIDPANVANTARAVIQGAQQINALMQQIQLMQYQLQQLQQVYASVAHLPDTLLQDAGAAMNTSQFRNPLPDSSTMGGIVGGVGSLGALTSLGQRYLDKGRVYDPSGYDGQAMLMMTNASSIAGIKAAADQLFQSAADHTKLLQNLEGALAASPDAKGVADIQGRIALEQTYIANRQVQAQAISTWQSAQVRLNEQQQAELRRCHYEQAHQMATTVGFFAGPAPDTCARAVAAMATSNNGASAPGSEGGGGGTGTGGGGTSVGVATGYDQYNGQVVGSGQCVALVQAADPSVGLTRTWAAGEAVQGNTSLQPGTPIATFDANGTYGNHLDGSSHAAIYLGQDASGMQVQDQWAGRATHVHTIPWSGINAANSGSAFRVITKRG